MADQKKWDGKMVAARLEEAVETIKRLPANGLKPTGYVSSWPPILREFFEAYGWNKLEVRLGPPSPEAIDRMEEVLEWLRWLEPDQVRLVWLHAEGVPRKLIMARIGVSRATAWRMWAAALVVIATRLNLSKERKGVETCC